MKFEFEPLNIKPEGNWFKRTFLSKHAKKTAIAMIIGAVAGFLFYYMTEGQYLKNFPIAEATKSTLFGAFFGLFITNSPCARGKC